MDANSFDPYVDMCAAFVGVCFMPCSRGVGMKFWFQFDGEKSDFQVRNLGKINNPEMSR